MKNTNLKQVGLKTTIPRLKILKILEQAQGRHLSAENIHQILSDEGEDIGLATVYRVLAQFESAGLVMRHHFEEDHAVFELNQGTHHDHLVCIKCGSIAEFTDHLIEQRQHEIAKKENFQMTDHDLNIYGVCTKCQ